MTKLFYALIGIVASFALFLAFYWALRLDSSIASFVRSTLGEPLYFWAYILLTLGTIVLFGVNVSFFVYRWRRFGPPKLKNQGSTTFGSIIGIAASSCPVCGSTILSAMGVAGGLAAFPLAGLELKALSFSLMILPIWLTRRDLKKLEDCKDDGCPAPRDASFQKKDQERLRILCALIIIVIFVGWNMLKTDPVMPKWLLAWTISANVSETDNELFNEMVAKVIPQQGFQSKIKLNDSIVNLVEQGVIDKLKFENLYEQNGGLPEEFRNILEKPSPNPILLTRENSNYYVNLLWPLGLSNYMSANDQSPIKGNSLFDFASTGGWDLGKDDNGGSYFNKFKNVELSPEQEDLATKIAQSTYRPCCNNSTFYQDCNHGSALLGLLELGAQQGLSEDELYREALAFNSFWFPDQYIQTALYFKIAKDTDWENVDPKIVLGEVYSSSAGNRLVKGVLNKIPNFLPQDNGGASCGT